MGKNGDQDINWAQNATLAACGRNGVDVHLFEVMDAGEYVYCGRMELVDQPHIDIQPGEDGTDRKVWMFPIRPVPDNDVKKPDMFVFKDMDDYRTRGKNVDAEYMKLLAERKKSGRKAPEKPARPTPAAAAAAPKPGVPPQVVGKRLNHKIYGEGTIIGVAGTIMVVSFDTVGEKKLGRKLQVQVGHSVE